MPVHKKFFPTMRLLLIALAAACSTGSALAEGRGFTYGGVLGLSFTSGGDTVDELRYVDGTTQTIKAGGQYNVKLGGELRFDNLPIQLQGTLNWHYVNDAASNAEASYTRYPLELLAFYNFNTKWRVGGGLRYILNPKYKFKFENDPTYEFKFEPSLGYVLEGEYFYSAGTSISARYVKVSLPWNYGPFSGKLDGSHIGFGFNIYW